MIKYNIVAENNDGFILASCSCLESVVKRLEEIKYTDECLADYYGWDDVPRYKILVSEIKEEGIKMKKLEIGTIIKYVSPKSIGISLNGDIEESQEKDVTYYQIEGSKLKHSKFGYDYIEYKVFNLTTSKFEAKSEMFIYDCLKDNTMQIMKGGFIDEKRQGRQSYFVLR